MHVFLQATLPKRVGQEDGIFKPYMKGVYMAYAMVGYCYFTVAICGYWAFGQTVLDNVLLSVAHPKWVVAVADMFVVVHVFGSYQVSRAYLHVGIYAFHLLTYARVLVGLKGLFRHAYTSIN